MSKSKNIIGLCAAATLITSTMLFAPHAIAKNAINYTGADLASNIEFVSTLESIEEDYDIVFNNYDLYTAIAEQVGTNFTVEKLRNIKTLRLDLTSFSNKDLSDLKYFTNLETLEIANGTVDCTNLLYNQNLTYVNFAYCDIHNSHELPNSISNLTLSNSRVIDSVLNVPYDTSSLSLVNSTLNKINFKHPEGLENFSFNGYSFLDLHDLKNCSNIKYISLRQCPNVRNPNVLGSFPKKTNIEVDEFCCIWGNQRMFNNIPSEYRSIMNKLDKIVESITSEDMTDAEKIEHLTVFTLAQIDYDYSSVAQTKEAEAMLTEYNTRPLTYALNSKSGVCVSFATFFQALANRVGLESYEPDSVNHTWNMVRLADEQVYYAYDLTQLDNPNAVTGTFDSMIIDSENDSRDYINDGRAEELVFYKFDYQQALDANFSYDTNVKLVDIPPIDTNIGYVNLDSPARGSEINHIRAQVLTADLAIIALVMCINDVIKKLKRNIRKHQKSKVKAYRRDYYHDYQC